MSAINNPYKTNLLIYAYVRQNISENTIDCIIHLIRLFYDQTFLWIFKHDELNYFQNTKTGKYITSKIFNCNDFQFKCIVYPNGDCRATTGHIILCCKPVCLPTNVDCILVYREIFCLETGFAYKKSHVIKTATKYYGHPIWCIPVKEYMYLNRITFGFHLEILRVNYKKQAEKRLENLTNIEIDKEINYQWLITGDLLKTFQTCHYGAYFQSPSFGIDNNWSLVCSPNGFRSKKDRKGRLVFGCQLLRFPNYVGKMKIKYKLMTSYDGLNGRNISYERCKIVSCDKSTVRWNSNTLLANILKTVNTALCLGVNIEILEMYDLNDKIIDECKWNRLFAPSFISKNKVDHIMI